MSIKRLTAFLLTLSVTAGATAAIAVEEVIIEPAEYTAEDTLKTTAANVSNNIIIPKTSQNKTMAINGYGAPIDKNFSLSFTIKHPNGAPEGRAVIAYGYKNWTTENGMFPPYKSKKITQNTKPSSSFTICFGSSESNYYTGTILVQAYIEENIDGEWVRTSDIETTNIYVVTNLTVSPRNNLFIPQLGRFDGDGLYVYYPYYYLGDGERDEYSDGLFESIVYRKAEGETQWTEVDHLYDEWEYNVSLKDWYNNTDVKNGKKYTYSVKTRIGEDWSKRSASVSYYYLNTPKGIAVKNSSTGKTMTTSWNRNSKANGYEVRYWTDYDPYNGNMLNLAKTRTISGYKNNSLTLKNRTPKKQYWIQVRSYKTVSGKKYYSNWSDLTLRYPE